jgi:hypothetical protein
VLIYCADYKCSHWIRMNADQRPNDIRLSDLEDKFTCTKHPAKTHKGLARF